MPSLTAAEAAHHVGGEILGDGSLVLTGIAAADEAVAGQLTFAEKPHHLEAALKGGASVIVVPKAVGPQDRTLLRVADPRIAIARLLPLFHPEEVAEAGVHPTATVAGSAQVDPSASVGPGCVIGAGARIGARSVLMGGNHVGAECSVGSDVRLHPNVVLYARTRLGDRVTIHAGTVIGSDGYGYVLDAGRHRKVLQVGRVEIHDDVEIGANTAIDRGALGRTVIGEGTKIDNLVHVAHNVVIGRHCLIMGQVGFAGSTRLGDYCVVASQSGIAGHLRLGNQSVVGAKSGVMRDVADGETVLGIPAAPHQQTKRQWLASQQLPEALRRLKKLEGASRPPAGGAQAPD